MAVDYFLKLDGIQGEDASKLFIQRRIRLLSWSWGANSLSSVEANGGSGSGKVDLDEFRFVTKFDKATVGIFRSICKGEHVMNATLFACKAGALESYLTVGFEQVFVTGVSTKASWVEIPAVSIEFSFDKITFDYRVQGKDGFLTSTGPVAYSLKQNKSS